MRNYKQEVEDRIVFIKQMLENAAAKGVVFGNSGGKDSAVVGILCKMACENTTGLILPCTALQNYGSDLQDATALAEQFGIHTHIVDLAGAYNNLLGAFGENGIGAVAATNIPPRLRMAALYAYAQTHGLLVAGTSNYSERYMGYFTKWGDNGCDFNPIGDLTATEVLEMLRYLCGPQSIINKAPSAGLYEGQTDEAEMGITYKELDAFLKEGILPAHKSVEIIQNAHRATAHKRRTPILYGE